MHELLTLLQVFLQRDTPETDRLIAAGDIPGANALLHMLKGCIPIFCGSNLCEDVERIEAMSKPGGSGDVRAAFDQLQPKLHRLLQEVNHYLDSSAGATP
jgi:hypothetical protein